jgi:hypothetical protein
MSVVGTRPLKLERGADFPGIVWTAYSVWTGNVLTSTLFNFSGYTADCRFKTNLGDSNAASVLVVTPTLGGALGTYTIPLISAANIETLLLSWPTGMGWWDCRFANASASPMRWVDHSRVTISPAATR